MAMYFPNSFIEINIKSPLFKDKQTIIKTNEAEKLKNNNNNNVRYSRVELRFYYLLKYSKIL